MRNKLSIKNATSMIDSSKDKIIDFAKSKIFDAIGIGLILAMIALILGVLELKEFTLQKLKDIVVEFVPFYIAALALTITYYTKGSFVGKSTDSFKATVEDYSEKVNNLTGDKIDALPDFCTYYNEKALHQMQETELKSVAIRFERFNEVTLDKDGNELQPLKSMTRQELLTLYNKKIVKVIIRAQNMKVKGIHANILLGDSNNQDITNLGKTEKQLQKSRTVKYAIGYVGSIAFMVLIGIKSILEWGWKGLLVVAFKILYVICRAYMRYFDGYKDITVSVKNHISRKTDILKEFEEWYNDKNKKVEYEQLKLEI